MLRTRIAALLGPLIATMVFGSCALAQSPPQPFKDVTPHYWAYGAILDLRSLGIVKGLPGNIFEPTSPVTRAQFVKMIVLAENVPVPTTLASDPFPDVKKTSWVAPFAAAAVQAGIVVLGPGRPFDATAPITKQDIATMVGRSLGLDAMAASAPAATFTDAATVAPWAAGYVSVAQQLGWMHGLPDKTFDPLASATKGQAAGLIDAVRKASGAPLEAQLAAMAQTLQITAPDATLQVGSSETLQVSVTGASGEVLPLEPTFTVSGAGTITPAGVFTASSPGLAVITATLGSLSQSTSVDVTPAGPSLTPIEGKGMWLLNADLVKRYGAASVVSTAVADGIHTLYLEVGSTYNSQGFWGSQALTELLPVAHAQGIAVMGWIYDTLQDPQADLTLAQQAYTFNVNGQTVDGLALDLETSQTFDPTVMGPFETSLRAELGPSALLVAVTYPPQHTPTAPYATYAATFNAIAPMDYWHSTEGTYSATQVQSYVETSISEIRTLANDPTLPIAVIGQSYDMFSSSGTGTNSPTPDEIQGAMTGAQAGGAIGFSTYRWATATTAEQQMFVATPFTPTLPPTEP